jgi:hypothetical protein
MDIEIAALALNEIHPNISAIADSGCITIIWRDKDLGIDERKDFSRSVWYETIEYASKYVGELMHKIAKMEYRKNTLERYRSLPVK